MTSNNILLIHGAGMDARVFDPVTPLLGKKGYSVIAPDLPGHGKSPGPTAPTITMMARVISRAAIDQKWQGMTVMGHSMGALVALELATINPMLVTRLVLLGAAEQMPVNRDLLKAAQDQMDEAVDMILKWGFDKTSPKIMKDLIRAIMRQNQGVLGSDLKACNDYTTAAEAAAKITCEVVIIAGEKDKMTPVVGAQNLAAHFKSCRLEVAPKAGHMMFLEQAKKVVEFL